VATTKFNELFFQILSMKRDLSQKLSSSFTYVLETVHSQKIPLPERCWTGRPPKSRRGIFNAFVAKAFLKIPTTLHLVERLQSDHHLRLICGFETRAQVPSESMFSRVFAEFAKTQLP
jgi:hypothetical protein